MPVAPLSARRRAAEFCRRFGLRVPILQAPMAGACPVGLAAAVANAGGMGGLGALMTAPDGIADWVRQFRGQSTAPSRSIYGFPIRPRSATLSTSSGCASFSGSGDPR